MLLADSAFIFTCMMISLFPSLKKSTEEPIINPRLATSPGLICVFCKDCLFAPKANHSSAGSTFLPLVIKLHLDTEDTMGSSVPTCM